VSITPERVVISAAPERIMGMSEKRRGGAWTEVVRNDEVACGLPREGVANGAAPERIMGMSENPSERG
jgi:hypothetical protein